MYSNISTKSILSSFSSCRKISSSNHENLFNRRIKVKSNKPVRLLLQRLQSKQLKPTSPPGKSFLIEFKLMLEAVSHIKSNIKCRKYSLLLLHYWLTRMMYPLRNPRRNERKLLQHATAIV